MSVLEFNVFVLFDANLLLFRVSRAFKLFTARVKATNNLLLHICSVMVSEWFDLGRGSSADAKLNFPKLMFALLVSSR